MRLLSFTAITEVVQGFSLSPILEASVDSGLSWGLLGWRGGEVSSVGLLHDGLCPPSEEDLRARWRLPCRGRKNILCFAELIFLKFCFPCWKMGCRWAQHPSLSV